MEQTFSSREQGQSPKTANPLESEGSLLIDHDLHVRPTFEAIYMRLAENLSERSTCHRLKVGTVITTLDFRKVLAVGYNGNASGLPNGCDRRHEVGNCGCLHSEENAVINCDSPRHIEKIVFVTHMPCAMCAKRLINLGQVRTVYYQSEYRTSDARQLFEHVGIRLLPLPSKKAPGES